MRIRLQLFRNTFRRENPDFHIQRLANQRLKIVDHTLAEKSHKRITPKNYNGSILRSRMEVSVTRPTLGDGSCAGGTNPMYQKSEELSERTLENSSKVVDLTRMMYPA